MRSLKLTLALFLQVLVAAFVFYTSLVNSLPLEQAVQKVEAPTLEQAQVVLAKPEVGPQAAPQVHLETSAKQSPEAQQHQDQKLQARSVSQQEPAKSLLKEQAADSPVVVNKKPAAPAKLAVRKEEPKQPMVEQQKPVQPQSYADAEKKLVAEQQQQVAVKPAEKQAAPSEPLQERKAGPADQPAVKGGLGPLHLLAATLCSYQADKPVADESLSLLYSRRAALRKSLFDFMSLKFTSLERFSSRLNSGVALEVVPPKIGGEPALGGSAASPTHGWPVVGKCTAHDLKLMAEAAWCECSDEASCASSKGSPAQPSEEQEPRISSNQHNRAQAARSLEASGQQEKSAIISKLLHVADVREAPVVESTIASLNLTQQQLAAVQAQAVGADQTRECRKNALRMTKALFNHLAEDQRSESSSWPKLYSQLSQDECARKRMIDIVGALAGYRTEASSIRRDNVEYAFAMDDLRTKVLESELNQPLTFDKPFIEVGQFLQQSVKLMLPHVEPNRAKLASMRYRSLLQGPVSADDQCIELHQRLLAKNYPTDCNPTQFGQLPDVLRMAASSLELWAIESELAKYQTGSQKALAKQQEQQAPLYSASSSFQQEVNECIANLVSY